jgi:hypothetical protein
MKKMILPFFASFTSVLSYSQQPIDVTDQTIKIDAGKQEEIYLGFAEGDKVIFNFQEVKNKDLKEIEISEYPSSSKFSDFKTSKIENKTFSIFKQSVYIFRFKNSALSGRVCNISVKRIPASDATKNFNTAVQWIMKQDTSWNTYTKDVVIGYDTVYLQKAKKELLKTEQKEELILDKPERVHSSTNANGNRTSIFFTLPQNIAEPNKTSTVIAWAYWVGVGNEANEAWKQNVKAVGPIVKTVVGGFTTALGAFAIGAVAELVVPKLGEDVHYSVADELNKNLFMAKQDYKVYDQGNGIAGYRKFTDKSLCQGTFFICLFNDNTLQGIDATVKVAAIMETNYYQDKEYTEMPVNPRYEKKLFKDPVIKTSKVPVTGF